MKNILTPFKHAFRGIFITLKTEVNAQIHLSAIIIVTTLGFYFQISLTDWIICLLLFGIVLSSEFINTCVEQICNILRDKYKLPYEGSRDIRDIAAGAVLVNSIIAAIIGILIFGKYLI